MQPHEDLEEVSIGKIISEEIEGLFTSLERIAYIKNESAQITKNNEFTTEVGYALIDRLEINPNNTYPVLNSLYNELMKFASLPSEHNWGKF